MTRRYYLRATAIAASVFVLSFAAVALTDPLPRVIWNASASAPLGLYRIQPDRDPALGALVGQLRSGTGTGTPSISLDVDLPRAVGAEVAVTAYRTVGEALTNVLRHSRATSCAVDVRTVGEDRLEICVADDGVGLPSGPPSRLGVGLGSLRRRAEALGGSLEVGPRAGGGTLLVMGLPTQERP